jgi:hypothetical protein
VRDGVIDVAVNALLGLIPDPLQPVGETMKDALEEPMRAKVKASADAEVLRAATAVLAAQTVEEMRRALEPRSEPLSSSAVVRGALTERVADLTERVEVLKDQAPAGRHGLTMIGSDFDRTFPIAAARTSSDAVMNRPYRPLPLSGFARVGGVILGDDPSPAPLDAANITWTFSDKPAITIVITRASGERVTLGPYPPRHRGAGARIQRRRPAGGGDLL